MNGSEFEQKVNHISDGYHHGVRATSTEMNVHFKAKVSFTSVSAILRRISAYKKIHVRRIDWLG